MLNPSQHEATFAAFDALVVAGPGTGKTRVIESRVGHLLDNPNNKIIVVTFTNDATAEIKARLSQSYGSRIQSRVAVSTFHKLSIRLLQRNQLMGTLVRDFEQYNIIKKSILLSGEDLTPQEAIELLDQAKSSIGDHPQLNHPFIVEYQAEMAKKNLTDLMDVMRNCVSALMAGKINPYQATHLLVDEAQDIDEIQLQWILVHAQSGCQVMLVGDDDQSVYGFRRSLGYEGMTRFEKSTRAKRIVLNQNYRCKAEILDAASRLITQNKERLHKSLIAEQGDGGKITLHRPADLNQEARLLISLLEESMRHGKGVEAGQWAVIARSNFQFYAIQLALLENDIPHIRNESKRIWPENVIAFLTILNGLECLEDSAIEAGLQVLGIALDQIKRICASNNLESLRSTGISTVPLDPLSKSYIDALLSWRKQYFAHRLNLVLVGVCDWLKSSIGKNSDNAYLIDSACSFMQKMSGSLAYRVNRLLNPERKDKSGSHGIQLHTMHSSKGLEFTHVFLCGVTANAIPSPKSFDIEEERRLMYVAMTRAKHHLHISAPYPQTPSVFVAESGLTFNEHNSSHQ